MFIISSNKTSILESGLLFFILHFLIKFIMRSLVPPTVTRNSSSELRLSATFCHPWPHSWLPGLCTSKLFPRTSCINIKSLPSCHCIDLKGKKGSKKKSIQNWKEIQNSYEQILQNKTAMQGKPIFLLQTNTKRIVKLKTYFFLVFALSMFLFWKNSSLLMTYWRGRKKLRF